MVWSGYEAFMHRRLTESYALIIDWRFTGITYIWWLQLVPVRVERNGLHFLTTHEQTAFVHALFIVLTVFFKGYVWLPRLPGECDISWVLRLITYGMICNLFVCFHCAGATDVVQMFSISRRLTVDVGLESVELDCDFRSDEFNLFDHPVQWYKTQLNETSPINLMGNLMEPFAAGRRFRVSLNRSHPRYNLQLTISGTETTMLCCSTFIMRCKQVCMMLRQNTCMALTITNY